MNFSSMNEPLRESRRLSWTACTLQLTLLLVAGCLDTASNYGAVLPAVNNGNGSGDGDNGKNDDKDDNSSGDGDDNSSGDGDDNSSGDGDDSSSGDGDGNTSQGDGGTKPPVMTVSKIKGTAKKAGCSSYQAQNGDDQCAGYYCGVSMAMIEAELKSGGKCEPTPEDVCSGKVTTKVASCARSTKSNPVNAFDSDEMIRAKTLTCVKNDKTIDATDECLGCFLDAAQCASKHCLTQCLTGDSAACDTCRINNNCNQPVPTCAGLPTPF